MAEGGSGIEGMRNDSAFARSVAEALSTPFRLVDVGCSGGLSAGWRVFGERLAAVAYDPDAEAIASLSIAETNPLVRYFAGYVGLPDAHPLRQRLGHRPFHHDCVDGRLAFERSLSLRRSRASGAAPDPIDHHFAETIRSWSPEPPVGGYDLDYAAAMDIHEPDLPGVSISAHGPPAFYLPSHLSELGFATADFLKIDVDGPDFEILRGAGDLLSRQTLLGVALEVTFLGSHDANDNTFHNVDRLMRAKGFDLSALSVRPYASAALPSPYMDRHPGITWQGRPFQGDAVYMRDLASPARSEIAAAASTESLLKLAALSALFDLPDQAAEVLLVHRARVAAIFDVDDGLERLAQQIQEPWQKDLPYRRWIEQFEVEDPFFFNTYARREQWLEGLMACARARPDLERRLAAAEIEAETARAEAQAMRRSSSWRITAPLRALRSSLRR